MSKEINRLKVLEFLQWNDKHGAYTDELRAMEKLEALTYEEALRDFFGVVNGDFYYGIIDNIFELSYEDVIKYAKENHSYEQTLDKLQTLLNCEIPNEDVYKFII